ncbi:hypothetical protein BD626DRAFT_577391 [Schizophyllum amplum]|uniref:Uncharacterized protein n=1 Tax=Schizophyllum amplum TaxID=97359 RepID=A0A550BSK0_9AGAR|nr:hypothetical protein BD626DRAFT_577391 [Auriculariopsis ampla]
MNRGQTTEMAVFWTTLMNQQTISAAEMMEAGPGFLGWVYDFYGDEKGRELLRKKTAGTNGGDGGAKGKTTQTGAKASKAKSGAKRARSSEGGGGRGKQRDVDQTTASSAPSKDARRNKRMRLADGDAVSAPVRSADPQPAVVIKKERGVSSTGRGEGAGSTQARRSASSQAPKPPRGPQLECVLISQRPSRAQHATVRKPCKDCARNGTACVDQDSPTARSCQECHRAKRKCKRDDDDIADKDRRAPEKGVNTKGAHWGPLSKTSAGSERRGPASPPKEKADQAIRAEDVRAIKTAVQKAGGASKGDPVDRLLSATLALTRITAKDAWVKSPEGAGDEMMDDA